MAAAPHNSPKRPAAAGGKGGEAAAPVSVLLLRPRERARQSAQKLRALGFAPFIAPLSVIRPLGAALPEGQNFTALLAASAHVFGRALPPRLRQLRALPLYCVGAKTAAAAKAAGFAPRPPQRNAAALAERLSETARDKNFRPLYLAGRPRRPLIEDFLRRAGVSFRTAEIYEARPLRPSAAQRAALPEQLDFILLYSGQNAAGLSALSAHIGAKTQILCLSARLSAAVPEKWRAKTKTAAAPHEAALLALLTKLSSSALACPASKR